MTNALDGIGFDDVDAVREFIEAWDKWRSLSLELGEARSEGRLVEAARLQDKESAALDAAFNARVRIHLGKTEGDGDADS